MVSPVSQPETAEGTSVARGNADTHRRSRARRRLLLLLPMMTMTTMTMMPTMPLMPLMPMMPAAWLSFSALLPPPVLLWPPVLAAGATPTLLAIRQVAEAWLLPFAILAHLAHVD
eukprot:COSAG06_NODE_179_length_20947_cov_53.746882_13_plen_115_part_00